MAFSKQIRRAKIKRTIRKRLEGTSERPRLTVYRSNKDIYVQVIDDLQGRTLVSASSLKDTKAHGASGVEQAKMVGQLIAEKGAPAPDKRPRKKR